LGSAGQRVRMTGAQLSLSPIKEGTYRLCYMHEWNASKSRAERRLGQVLAQSSAPRSPRYLYQSNEPAAQNARSDPKLRIEPTQADDFRKHSG
jgi:hypothetical protein